jgi:hypothetical protein
VGWFGGTTTLVELETSDPAAVTSAISAWSGR